MTDTFYKSEFLVKKIYYFTTLFSLCVLFNLIKKKKSYVCVLVVYKMVTC